MELAEIIFLISWVNVPLFYIYIGIYNRTFIKDTLALLFHFCEATAS